MDDPYGNFAALTGNPSEDVATEYLSMCDFDPSAAAQLWTAAHGGDEQKGGDASTVDPFALPEEEEEVTPVPPPEAVKGPTRLDAFPDHLGGGAPQYSGGGGMDANGNFSHGGKTKQYKTAEPDGAIEVLFSPPVYKFRGTVAEACRMGQINERYIVLNILAAKEFVSGQVNRDIWRNDVIQMQMEAYFILFQEDSSSELGQQTMASYKINPAELPYVAILDPATKSTLLEISRKRYIRDTAEGPRVLADYFSEKLTDFLDRKGPFIMPRFGGNPDEEEDNMSMEARGSTKQAVEEGSSSGGVTHPSDEDAELLATALALSGEVAATGRVGGAAESLPIEVDMSLFASELSGAMRIRVRLPSGAWDVQVDATTVSVQLLAQAILVKVDKAKSAESTEKLNDVIELRGGFPLKPLCSDLSDSSILLKDTPLRSGDTINPHLKE